MATLAHQFSTNCQVSPRRPESPARFGHGMISRSGALLRLWGQRMRERTELARLSDRDLHDIGLSRGDVDQLLAKPFWRA
jgi:uncharacterized protein YjiS (DUF1127 family)